jgi:hypothetical protein
MKKLKKRVDVEQRLPLLVVLVKQWLELSWAVSLEGT